MTLTQEDQNELQPIFDMIYRELNQRFRGPFHLANANRIEVLERPSQEIVALN